MNLIQSFEKFFWVSKQKEKLIDHNDEVVF